MVRRVVLFIALFVAVALVCSIRVPVVVTGVAYENGGTRAYSNAASDYTYKLIRNWVRPPTSKLPPNDESYWSSTPPAKAAPAPPGAASEKGPWNDYVPTAQQEYSADEVEYAPSEAAPALDVNRYFTRIWIIFVGLGVLWFGVIPYYSQLKRIGWLLPLFLYVLAAIWRLLYVPCEWLVRARYYAIPEEIDAETRPLWDIGTARVRYGLVFFEELVLLVIVAVSYGCAFVAIRYLRPGKRVFPFPGRGDA